MDFPDQLIPQESQPLRNLTSNRSILGQVYEIKKTNSINFLCPIYLHFSSVSSFLNRKSMSKKQAGITQPVSI